MVHVHIQYDPELSRFYRRLTRRKLKQVALMATVWKMMKAVYWMLQNDEPHHTWPSGKP